MKFKNILSVLEAWFLNTGIRIIVIALITFIVIRILRVTTSKLMMLFLKRKEDEESRKRAQTLASVIKNLLTVIVFIITTMTLLGQLGIEIGPLLAAAGIVGLAIGFAGQNLVRDLINGFFIFFWDQIRVGDVIQVAGKSGLVESINLKMTVLRDLAGNVHFIPNGNIDIVTNMTKDFSCHLFEVGVAYREDVDEVMKLIEEMDEELRNVPEFKDLILEPIEVLGVDQFADSAVVIKARVKTRPGKQWTVAREFNRRVKKKFEEKNIEIPFPHLTLYLGQDKKGQAPPLRVSLEK